MPPQVSYVHPAGNQATSMGTAYPSSQTPRSLSNISQRSLAQQLYASSVRGGVAASSRDLVNAPISQPTFNVNPNPNALPNEQSQGQPQSALGSYRSSSMGVGAANASGIPSRLPPVQSRHYSLLHSRAESPSVPFASAGIPSQHGSYVQSMNPPGHHVNTQNTTPLVALTARPPSQVYFNRPQSQSPPLAAPKPQLPPGSHNIELSPSLPDNQTAPLFMPTNQVTSPIMSVQPLSAYPQQAPAKTNAQITTELAARKAKEGAQQTVKVLKKMGKASKTVGKAALKKGGAMLTSPAAAPVTNNIMNPNAAASLINTLCMFPGEDQGFDVTDLQAVIQGQPDADYQSIINALLVQQQQMQGTTSGAQASSVDYQGLIAELRSIQQVAAQQQQQAQANMTSAVAQAQAQAAAQQHAVANMQLQALQAQATHRPLTPAALYQNAIQFQAMQNAMNNGGLGGGPNTNIQTLQAPTQGTTTTASQGNAVSLYQNALDMHQQASQSATGNTAYERQVSSQPTSAGNGRQTTNTNAPVQSQQDLQYLMEKFLKLQQQQQMMNTLSSPRQQVPLSQAQIALLQAYQQQMAGQAPPATTSQSQQPQQIAQPHTQTASQQPQRILDPPNSDIPEQVSTQTQQFHSQQRFQPSSSRPQSQHPQRPPSISQVMSNPEMQHPISSSSVPPGHYASPNPPQQQAGSQVRPTSIHRPQSTSPPVSSHSRAPSGDQQQTTIPSTSTQMPQRQLTPSSRRATSPTPQSSVRGPRSRILPPPPYLSPEAAPFPPEKLAMQTQSQVHSAGGSSSSSQSGPSGSGSGFGPTPGPSGLQSQQYLAQTPEQVHADLAQSTVHVPLNPMPHPHAAHSPEPYSSVQSPLNAMSDPQTGSAIGSQSSVQSALNPMPDAQIAVSGAHSHTSGVQEQSVGNASDALNPMPEPPPPSYDTPELLHPPMPSPPPPPVSQPASVPAEGQPQIPVPSPPHYQDQNQPAPSMPQASHLPVQGSNAHHHSSSQSLYQVPPPAPLEDTGPSQTAHHPQHSASIPPSGSQHSLSSQSSTQSAQQSGSQTLSQSLSPEQMQSLIDAYHQGQESLSPWATSPSPQSPPQPIANTLAPVQQLQHGQSPSHPPTDNGGPHQFPSPAPAPTPAQHPQSALSPNGAAHQTPFSQAPHPQNIQDHAQTPYQANGPQSPPPMLSQQSQSPTQLHMDSGVQRPPIRPPVPGQVQQSSNVQGHIQQTLPPLTMNAGAQRPPNPLHILQQLSTNPSVQIPPLRPPTGQAPLPPPQPGSPVQMQSPLNMNAGAQRPPFRPALQAQQALNVHGSVQAQQWPPKPPSQTLPAQSALQQQHMSSAGQQQQQSAMQNILNMMSNLGLQRPQQQQQQQQYHYHQQHQQQQTPQQSPQISQMLHQYSQMLNQYLPQGQQSSSDSSSLMSQMQHLNSQSVNQNPSTSQSFHVQQYTDSQPQDMQFTYDSMSGVQGQGGTLEIHAQLQEQQTQSGQYDEVTIQATYDQADGAAHSQQDMQFTFDASYQQPQLDAQGQGQDQDQQDMWSLAQQDPSVLQNILQGYSQPQVQDMQSFQAVYQSQEPQQQQGGILDMMQASQQGQDSQSWSLDASFQEQQDLQGFADTTYEGSLEISSESW